MTRASDARAMRQSRKKAERDRERSMARLRRTSGDDAATDRQLQEHADQWAKRTHGEHARGKHCACACGNEYLALLSLDDTPLEKTCRTCKEKGATT